MASLADIRKKIEERLPELVDEALSIALQARSAHVRLEAIQWLASVVGLTPQEIAPTPSAPPVLVKVEIGALPAAQDSVIEGELVEAVQEAQNS